MKRYAYILSFFILLLVGRGSAFGQTTILSEGFEGGAVPPTGWVDLQGGSGNTWVVDNGTWGGTSHTGTYYAEYQYNSTNAANTWLISKGVSLTAGITYTISCWENTSSLSGTYPENLKMTVGTAQTIAGQTTTLLTLASLTNETYVQQTTTYTPGSSGTFYFGWQCYSLANENGLYLDDILITGPTPCTAPSTQASAFVANTITSTSMKANWTRGNGNNVLVIAKAGSAPTNPTSGTTYTANAAYGSGTAVGGGFCVYNGTGTSVSLTGLTASTTYYFAIYEYNTTGTCYDLTALTGNGSTICIPPTTQATITGYTNNNGTTLTANWTRGNGTAGVIVVARLTATTAIDPTSGTAYTANAVFGSGNTTGTGNYVVYAGTGTTVNITALTQNTGYTFTVYEYNTVGNCYMTPGSSSAVTTSLSYCTPSTASSSTYINNFSTTAGVTNITNNGTGFTTGGYANYSTQSCSQYKNTSINWSVTNWNSSGSSSIAIWVDWNNNGVFTDAGENVYNSAAYLVNGTYTGSFTVPSAQAPGSYRMRVLTDWNATTPTSCVFAGGTPRGEAEDYTFIVPVTCITPGAPTGVSGTALGLTSAKFSWTANATGGTAPVTYSWLIGTNSGGACGQTTVTNPVSPWVVPAAVTSINLYIWGAGGGGGGGTTGTNWGNGGGGGGGACSVQTVAVSAGQSYNIVYGTAGTAGSSSGGSGGPGGKTTFIGPAGTYSASGGSGGAGASPGIGVYDGGAGGSTGTGTVHSGGNGSAGNDNSGITGTGGGGGGSTGNGTTPSSACGVTGTGGTGAFPGGNGGYNTYCSSSSWDAPGTTGSPYGGGGSGDNSWTANEAGGSGGAGAVVITYGSAVIDQGTTTNLSDTSYALTCGTTYYVSVYATTGCNGTSSACATSGSFATNTCCTQGNAGPDQYVCNTVTSATMAATGSGTWTQVSGPNTATIGSANSTSCVMSGLIVGTYVFKWSCGTGASYCVVVRQP